MHGCLQWRRFGKSVIFLIESMGCGIFAILYWPTFIIAPQNIFIVKVFKLLRGIAAPDFKLQDDAVGDQEVGPKVSNRNHFFLNLL